MNKRITGVLIVLVLLGVVFLLNRKDVNLVKQDNAELQPLSTSGSELKSVIHFYNPNFLSVTINRIHERFFVNGTQIGELDVLINQGIAGRKESEFPVSIRFSKDDYNGIIAGDSLTKHPVVIVEGEITSQNFTNEKKIAVHQAILWKE
jgi:LEA14-like dessication related protein